MGNRKTKDLKYVCECGYSKVIAVPGDQSWYSTNEKCPQCERFTAYIIKEKKKDLPTVIWKCGGHSGSKSFRN